MWAYICICEKCSHICEYDSHICEYCLDMILTYANIVCLAKLVCLTIVTINNIYWIQKNSIEICTSFGFEPLHQKMYYSFILTSEFNKSGKKKWQEVFAATGWFVFQHQYWRRILCPLIIMVIHLLMQNLSAEKLGFQP